MEVRRPLVLGSEMLQCMTAERGKFCVKRGPNHDTVSTGKALPCLAAALPAFFSFFSLKDLMPGSLGISFLESTIFAVATGSSNLVMWICFSYGLSNAMLTGITYQA